MRASTCQRHLLASVHRGLCEKSFHHFEAGRYGPKASVEKRSNSFRGEATTAVKRQSAKKCIQPQPCVWTVICAMQLNSCFLKSCFFFGFVLDGLPPLGPLLFLGGGLRVCWAFASWPSFFCISLSGVTHGCEGLMGRKGETAEWQLIRLGQNYGVRQNALVHSSCNRWASSGDVLRGVATARVLAWMQSVSSLSPVRHQSSRLHQCSAASVVAQAHG